MAGAGSVVLALAILILILKKGGSKGKENPTESKPEPVAQSGPETEVSREDTKTPVPQTDKIREGFKKSRAGILSKLAELVSGGRMDEAMWEGFEEMLVLADTGAETAAKIRERVEKRLGGEGLTDYETIKNALMEETGEILRKAAPAPPDEIAGLRVCMVVGVNGTGKTTTAGKIASLMSSRGGKPMLAAADTFRAAAAEQLEKWATESGSEFVRGKEGSAPATVAFDAVKSAEAKNCDCLILDTAGRLHTKTDLMGELAAVKKAVAKAKDGAPHEVLLVLDATTGQNAIRQTEMFDEAAGITGIVLTKIDGTAKGGVAVAIAERLEIPVLYLGTGEGPEDITEFDPQQFVSSLFEEEV